MHLNNPNPRFDPDAQTQQVEPAAQTQPAQPKAPYFPPGPTPDRPADPMGRLQPIRIQRVQRRRSPCLSILVFWFLVSLIIYFLAPFRTNILLLGIDRTPEGTALGRSDTIILFSVQPLQPQVAALSIPRDLWVNIPNVGENRINTAHFFAEGEKPGSGPAAALNTVQTNFGVPLRYFARLRFDGFQEVIDAIDGVTVELASPTAGYPAGSHRLNGEQALAFVRSRQGSDDFFRMGNAQLLIRSAGQQMLKPASWPRIPAVLLAVRNNLDTNLPIWLWPRLGLAVLRLGPSGIDYRTLDREMVTPFTTNQGANVLLPQWDKIDPLVAEMFSGLTIGW